MLSYMNPDVEEAMIGAQDLWLMHKLAKLWITPSDIKVALGILVDFSSPLFNAMGITTVSETQRMKVDRYPNSGTVKTYSIEQGIKELDKITARKLEANRPIIVSILGGGGMGTSTLGTIISKTGIAGVRTEDITIIDTDLYLPRYRVDKPGLFTHDNKIFFKIPENGLMEDYLNFRKIF